MAFDPEEGSGDDTSVIYRILFVIVVALMLWWMFLAGEGEREFKQSEQALQHVTSWRQESRAGSQENEEAEIACPDRGHWLRHVRSQSKDGVERDSTFESVEIGSKSYPRSSLRAPGEQSERESKDDPKVTARCTNLMRGEYLYPLPNYNHLIQHTRIVKGAIDTVHGLKCQEWTTVPVIPGRFAAVQQPDDSQICIGLSDHLPRRIKYEKAEYIFYDWNTPIQIQGSRYR